MDWEKIGQRHWRSGEYEITHIGNRYCLWNKGKFITHSSDLDKTFFEMPDFDRLKHFATDCRVYDLV